MGFITTYFGQWILQLGVTCICARRNAPGNIRPHALQYHCGPVVPSGHAGSQILDFTVLSDANLICLQRLIKQM